MKLVARVVDKPGIWVSTDLGFFESRTSICVDDVIINGKTFRRIDANYYAWLLAMLGKAKRKLSRVAYVALWRKFRLIESWIVANYGVEVLSLVKLPSRYRPPVGAVDTEGDLSRLEPYLYDFKFAFPEQGSFKFSVPVLKSSLKIIMDIKPLALELGWTAAQLLRNRSDFKFPLFDYGLVTMIGKGGKLEEINNDCAIIVGRKEAWKQRYLRINGPSHDRIYKKI